MCAPDEIHDIFPHIIGGYEISPPKKYEFLVALVQKGATPFDGQFCGGSLITANHVREISLVRGLNFHIRVTGPNCGSLL
jgi:secreted trypsin-like serine protease